MTPDQLKAAAQVMLDATKPGAVVESLVRGLTQPLWVTARTPTWDWLRQDFRVAQPKPATLDDLPPVCWVRCRGSGGGDLVIGIDTVYLGGSIHVGDEWHSLLHFSRGGYEYSADRKTWTPFS